MVKMYESLNLDRYNEYLNNIIQSRGKFNPPSEYYEVHHIVPRSFGGQPESISHTTKHDNLIWLTLDEHYTAHKILALDNLDNYKLVYAYMLMSQRSDGSQIKDAKEYKLIREAFIKHDKEINTGKPSPMKGKKFGEEVRKKVSDRTKEVMSDPEVRAKISKAAKGRIPWNHDKTDIYSNDTLKKMSDKKKGKKLSDEHRRHIGEGNVGRLVSKETKEKISQAQSGENCKHNKAIYCVELDTIYYNCKYAAECLGISASNIVQVCKGKRKTSNGYHFRYIEDEN